MNSTLYGFILTIMAGLSTMVGCIFGIFKFKNKNNIILFTLSFASSVMLFLSLIDLIPEGVKYLNLYYTHKSTIILCFIFVSLGILLSLLIDILIPVNSNNLYRVGILSLIAIIFHNVLEGMATFLMASNDFKLGLKLAISIGLHNIPEGISIFIPIYYASNSKLKAFLYTIIASLSEPFGAVIVYIFLRKYITLSILGLILLLIAGVMIYISIFELLKETNKYQNKKFIIISYLLGLILVLVNIYIFSN